MQRIQMKGEREYQNYCAAYNDFTAEDLPRFANINEYIAHDAAIAGEKDILMCSEKFDEFMTTVLGLVPN